MEMSTHTQQRAFVELPMESSDGTSSGGLRANDGDIIRSERNILRWASYLPADCVRTMIRMKWDITT